MLLNTNYNMSAYLCALGCWFDHDLQPLFDRNIWLHHYHRHVFTVEWTWSRRHLQILYHAPSQPYLRNTGQYRSQDLHLCPWSLKWPVVLWRRNRQGLCAIQANSFSCDKTCRLWNQSRWSHCAGVFRLLHVFQSACSSQRRMHSDNLASRGLQAIGRRPRRCERMGPVWQKNITIRRYRWG